MQPSKHEVLIRSLSLNKGWSNKLMLSMLLRPVGRNMIFTDNTVMTYTFSCLNQSKNEMLMIHDSQLFQSFFRPSNFIKLLLSKYFLHVKLLFRGANVTIFKLCLYPSFEINKTVQKFCKPKVSLKSVN